MSLAYVFVSTDATTPIDVLVSFGIEDDHTVSLLTIDENSEPVKVGGFFVNHDVADDDVLTVQVLRGGEENESVCVEIKNDTDESALFTVFAGDVSEYDEEHLEVGARDSEVLYYPVDAEGGLSLAVCYSDETEDLAEEVELPNETLLVEDEE